MTAAGHDAAREWASHWCQRWFLDANGNDRLVTPEGVSVGWVTHVEAYNLLLGLALTHLGVSSERASLVRRVKAGGWDRLARWWGLRVVAPVQQPATGDRPVVFVVEIPTPSMLEPTALVADRTPRERRIVACADPRAYRLLRRRGLEVHSLALPLREEVRCLRIGARLIPMLEAAEKRHPEMPLGGTDLADRAIHLLTRSLRRSLPWIAVEHRALLRLDEAVRPGAWAVASDQHRMGRLVAHVAGGRKVTVLQHGMPQAEIGYLPIVADRIAAWSPSSVEWFVRHGAPEERIVALGNPRLDHVPGLPRQPARTGPSAVRLLLALSPSAVSTNERVVRTTLAAVAALGNADLVIKLHPGHREWGWVRDLVASSGLRSPIRIEHHGSLESILSTTDIAIVHRSTVALEAMAAGIPVVVVESDLPSVADAELRDAGLTAAGDGAGLVAALEALREPVAREQWLGERHARILHHAGPLDGRSAKRIAEVLLEDAGR